MSQCTNSCSYRSGPQHPPCPHELCRLHLRQVINDIIKKGADIKCPACQQSLNPQDLVKWMDEDIEKGYVRLCIEQTVQNSQYGYTVCPKCGNGQYHLGGDAAPIVQCEKCENDYCYKDKIVWSADHDCNDYGNAIGKLPENVKPCPTCKARLKYQAGCRRTTCTNDKQPRCPDFCWLCMGRDPYNNSIHGNGYWRCTRVGLPMPGYTY